MKIDKIVTKWEIKIYELKHSSIDMVGIFEASVELTRNHQCLLQGIQFNVIIAIGFAIIFLKNQGRTFVFSSGVNIFY